MLGRDKRTCANLARQLAPQISLIAFCALLYLTSSFGLIPSPEAIGAKLLGALQTNGLPLISLCALLENIVGLNVYFPGALAILAGMALTAGNLPFAIATYFAIYIPSYGGNWISYLLGRKERTALGRTETPTHQEIWLYALAYCHPQLASLKAFSSGLNGRRPQWFLAHSLPASLAWSVSYAVAIYNLGISVNILDYFPWLFIIYLVLWTTRDMVRFFKRARF